MLKGSSVRSFTVRSSDFGAGNFGIGGGKHTPAIDPQLLRDLTRRLHVSTLTLPCSQSGLDLELHKVVLDGLQTMTLTPVFFGQLASLEKLDLRTMSQLGGLWGEVGGKHKREGSVSCSRSTSGSFTASPLDVSA